MIPIPAMCFVSLNLFEDFLFDLYFLFKVTLFLGDLWVFLIFYSASSLKNPSRGW